MHIHVVSLLVIVILAALAFYVVRSLVAAQPLRNVLLVLVLVASVLAVLVSLGLLGGAWFTISP